MRIVFLLTTSLDSPYGGGRCWPFARELARRGHDVHVAALHHDWVIFRRAGGRLCERRDGVWVRYVGQMHVRKRGSATTYFGPLQLLWVLATGTLGLLWTALKLRADLYHIGKPHPQNSLAGLLTARLLHRPVLLDYDDLEAESNRTSNGLQRRVLNWLETHVPRWVDGVTTHASFLAQRLLSLGVPSENILRLPNAVDEEWFVDASVADGLPVEGQPPTATTAPLILYVGTLSLANHPVDLLLRAFAELVDHEDDSFCATLRLVGGGPDIDGLRQLARDLRIADRCDFLGRVARADVPAHFAQATVSVDPVLDDDTARARWPLKIVESLAAGVPVITGDVGNRREMLGLLPGDQPAGVIVPPGEVEALARALRALLAEPAQQTRLRANCRARAQRYQTAALTSALLTFYQAVCLRSGRPRQVERSA